MMTSDDEKTLVREWSSALRKSWFIPFLVAAGAGLIAFKVAEPLDPVRYSAITYVYTPPNDADAFQDVIDALPADVERLPDSHGNQHLLLVAPTFAEARDRLVSVVSTLRSIAEASLDQPNAAADAEQAAWFNKVRSQSVSVSQRGGGGEIACMAIAWAFMLAIAGILFARSRKCDSERASVTRTVHL